MFGAILRSILGYAETVSPKAFCVVINTYGQEGLFIIKGGYKCILTVSRGILKEVSLADFCGGYDRIMYMLCISGPNSSLRQLTIPISREMYELTVQDLGGSIDGYCGTLFGFIMKCTGGPSNDPLNWSHYIDLISANEFRPKDPNCPFIMPNKTIKIIKDDCELEFQTKAIQYNPFE